MKTVLLFLLLGSFSGMIGAMQNEDYQLPPQSIVDVVDAAPEPAVAFSPDGKWMLLIQRPALPAIADVSRRWIGLAGMRIDPVANSGFRTDFFTGLQIRPTAAAGEPVSVGLPDGVRIANVSWSHRSDAVAFSVVGEQGTGLWMVKPENPAAPVRLVENISTLFGFVQWMPDGQGLICQAVPEDRGAEPVASTVPSGPNIQESSGNTSPTRTYQDLLTSQHDENLFEYFATTALVHVGLDGTVRKLGPSGMYVDASVAPDGEHLLVTAVRRPFSRLMTMGSFPQTVQVWDMNANVVATIAETPLAENIPIEGVPTWRRRISWRPDHPAALVWAEALDGGDPARPAEFRDQVMTQAAPFDSPPEQLCKVEHRFVGVSWTSQPVQMFCSEYDRDRRWIRTLVYDVADMSRIPKAIVDRSMRDLYADPGNPVQEPDASGFPVIVQRDGWIWMSGRGSSENGDLPFLDRVNLSTLASERIWRCEMGVYETVEGLVFDESGNATGFVTEHESPQVPPNYRMRAMDGSVREELTSFPDPTPQIRGIRKELVTYQRADGVQLSATMYLPEGWQPGQRLPMLVWAYPVEFNDASTAGQITTSPSRFIRISGLSHLALVLEGYAVMDNATMPVIGDPETMNDTFVEQIVGAAQAAIDKAVAMGVADPQRVAVGGHSYGAFMTANLLAHCDLFRAGISRSGAYNRTLTPFGFQAERRPYWKARDVYEKVSPFTWADQIKSPLLLIHGEKDNNPGTFPVQSERMYQAIKGNGGTVRLVMLPEESHGYRARESVLHTHAEMINWLNRYLKSPGEVAPAGDGPERKSSDSGNSGTE